MALLSSSLSSSRCTATAYEQAAWLDSVVESLRARRETHENTHTHTRQQHRRTFCVTSSVLFMYSWKPVSVVLVSCCSTTRETRGLSEKKGSKERNARGSVHVPSKAPAAAPGQTAGCPSRSGRYWSSWCSTPRPPCEKTVTKGITKALPACLLPAVLSLRISSCSLSLPTPALSSAALIESELSRANLGAASPDFTCAMGPVRREKQRSRGSGSTWRVERM